MRWSNGCLAVRHWSSSSPTEAFVGARRLRSGPTTSMYRRPLHPQPRTGRAPLREILPRRAPPPHRNARTPHRRVPGPHRRTRTHPKGPNDPCSVFLTLHAPARNSMDSFLTELRIEIPALWTASCWDDCEPVSLARPA